jgi:hypothetical protein
MNRTLAMAESKNLKQSAQANRELDEFVDQFDILVAAAEAHKEMQRRDKGIGKLRRLVEAKAKNDLRRAVEAMAGSMSPLDKIKMDAKDQFHRRHIEGLLRGKTSLKTAECIAIYSATRKHTGHLITAFDVQAQSLTEDTLLCRRAVDYVKSVGLKVS